MRYWRRGRFDPFRWPLDPVLDHASLQRMSRDPKTLRGLDDAPGLVKRGLAQNPFRFT